MKFYVFDNEETAIGAEAFICYIANAPRVGFNAKTKTLAQNKCTTKRWAIPQQRLDGKWVFPYVGDDKLALYPSEVIDGFETNFPNTKEEYNEEWFPQSKIGNG